MEIRIVIAIIILHSYTLSFHINSYNNKILQYSQYYKLINKSTYLLISTKNNINNNNNINNSQSNKSNNKLDFNEDYYSVLEVSPDINPIDLKKAYYKIVFKYHPDNKDNDNDKLLANKQMMVINAAYKVLKDPILREQYDKKRSIGLKGEKSDIKESKKANYNKSNTYNYQSNSYTAKQTVEEPTESIFDIFNDLWSDITANKGSNLFEDMIDFLESQTDSNGDIIDSNKTLVELNNELNVVNQTSVNLEKHLKDLKISLELDKSLLEIVKNKNINVNNNNKNNDEFFKNEQEKLRLTENIKSYESRIKFVEKQIRRYKNHKIKLTNEINNKNNRKNDNYTSNSEDSYSKSSINSNDKGYDKKTQIEKELEKMKREMGLK